MKNIDEKKLIKMCIKGAVSMVMVAVFFVTAQYAFAEFTKSSRAKRVIAAYESGGLQFSSNYLMPGSEAPKTIYMTDATASGAAFNVTVCNYPQKNPMSVYEQDIHYVIEAEVVDVSGGSPVRVTDSAIYPDIRFIDMNNKIAGGFAYTSDTLTGGVRDSDEYKVYLPIEMTNYPYLYLRVTATPDHNLQGLQPLSLMFNIAQATQRVALVWEIEATDDTNQDVNEFSGFNYRVYGTGRGTVTLNWPDDKLIISEVFERVVSSTASGGSITFEVDADNRNSYDIQFYPIGKGAVTSWDEIEAGDRCPITCVFNESE